VKNANNEPAYDVLIFLNEYFHGPFFKHQTHQPISFADTCSV